MNTQQIINMFSSAVPLKTDNPRKKLIGKKVSKTDCLAMIEKGLVRLDDFSLFWRNDIDIVLACIQRRGKDFEHASNQMRKIWKVCVSAFKKNPRTLMDMDEEICCKITSRLPKEKVLLLVRKWKISLACLDHKWRDDKDIVLECVSTHPTDLEFASTRMKEDVDVVLTAVKKNPRVLSYASKIFYDNDKFREYAFTINGGAFLVDPRAIRKFVAMDSAMINETSFFNEQTGLEEYNLEKLEKHPTYVSFKSFYDGKVSATYIRKMEATLLGRLVKNKPKKRGRRKKSDSSSEANNQEISA